MNYDNTKYIKPAISVFLRMLGGSIIAFIFYFGLSAYTYENPVGQILTTILFLFVYSIPVYTVLHRFGDSDCNQAKLGNIKPKFYRGFLIGLLASLPQLIFGIIFILSKFVDMGNLIVAFKFINPYMVSIANFIQNSGYIADFTIPQVLLTASLSLVPAILCGIFYFIGYKQFIPTEWLVYKKEK